MQNEAGTAVVGQAFIGQVLGNSVAGRLLLPRVSDITLFLLQLISHAGPSQFFTQFMQLDLTCELDYLWPEWL